MNGLVGSPARSRRHASVSRQRTQLPIESPRGTVASCCRLSPVRSLCALSLFEPCTLRLRTAQIRFPAVCRLLKFRLLDDVTRTQGAIHLGACRAHNLLKGAPAADPVCQLSASQVHKNRPADKVGNESGEAARGVA